MQAAAACECCVCVKKSTCFSFATILTWKVPRRSRYATSSAHERARVCVCAHVSFCMFASIAHTRNVRTKRYSFILSACAIANNK